ncbi:YqgE/AlgH family protein [Corynebacterium sp. H128]|uniref:YqgE/AlgH family protein n=1 Tax=unclassified Corynebacterium TaxID=2624378 RepID=UPI0030979B6F
MEDFFADRLFRALELGDIAPGSVLLAAPGIDLDFRSRTAVLIVEQTPERTLGITLNKRGDVAVANVMEQLVPLVAAPQAFYVGGDENLDSVVALGVLKAGLTPADIASAPFLRYLAHRIVVVDLRAPLAQLQQYVESVRLFAGYLEWQGDRLEEELGQGYWYATPALASDVIAPGAVDLWAEILRRQPMPLPLFATFPSDLEDN